MGKLAERLADARRSGVYRVEVTEALEEAAALNGYPLSRIALDGASGMSPRELGSRALRAAASPAPGHVLLFTGFESQLHREPEVLQPLFSSLDVAAAGRRAAGQPFFAAFLDPGGMLPLGPLYNWHRRTSEVIP